jgi:hypothetical protein
MSATILPFEAKQLDSLADDALDLKEAILDLIAEEGADPLIAVVACISTAVDHVASEDGIKNLRAVLECYIDYWREDNPSQ